MMYADSYQEQARATAVFPREQAVSYLTIGLCNEAGEVAGKIKKKIRDSAKWNPTEWMAWKDAVTDELGDVCWYLAALCTELDISLGDVMQRNLNKLKGRAQRGTIHGSGDKR